MQHTLPTINFNPDIKLKVNVSLRGGASDTPVGGCCWPPLGEQLVHSSKARGFLARGAPAQAQVGGRYQQDIYLSRGYKAFPNYVHIQWTIRFYNLIKTFLEKALSAMHQYSDPSCVNTLHFLI